MELARQPLVDASPPRGLIAGTSYSIRALWDHRELLGLLVRRELKAKYKDSALGFIWSFGRPLVQLLIYYIAIGKFLGAERNIPAFAIFIFTGLTVWAFYSEMITVSTGSIVNNGGLVKKVYVPRELFPLASLGSAVVNFAVQLAILVAAILITQPPPFFAPQIWLVPLAFLVLVVFSLAVGLLLSALNVFLRDVRHLVDVLMLVLFWASPIVYSFGMVQGAIGGTWLEQVYLANPVTTIVIAFQQGLWAAGASDPTVVWPDGVGLRLAILGLASVLLLWVAQRIFARLEGNFAQEL